jgi:hypothetical protein
MSENFTSITGKELIRRILGGERDFSRTRLKPETSLHDEGGFGNGLLRLPADPAVGANEIIEG